MIKIQTRFHPHQSAISRNKPSKPLDCVFELGFARKGLRVLDYGCGRGDDVRWLRAQNIDAVGYDPHEAFGFPWKKSEPPFDLVLMTYVVNVISTPQSRREAVQDAWISVAPGGQLFIAARSRTEIRGAAKRGKWKRHGDGFISDPKRGIFQKGHDCEDLKALLRNCNPSRVVEVLFPTGRAVLAFK